MGWMSLLPKQKATLGIVPFKGLNGFVISQEPERQTMSPRRRRRKCWMLENLLLRGSTADQPQVQGSCRAIGKKPSPKKALLQDKIRSRRS